MIVTINTTGLSYMNGIIDGMSQGVSKKSFISSAVDLAHDVLNVNFEQWMDLAAMNDPQSLMHVYEWGQLGTPAGRLWESKLIGDATKTKRSVVVWKPSTVPTPVRPELLEPGPTGKTVKEGVHVFVWKAPVMESGMSITVSPQSSGSGSLAYINKNGELKITKQPSHFIAGGGKTTGQFLKHYTAWWNTMAQGVFNEEVAPKLQANMTAGALRGAKKAGHRTFFRIAASDSSVFKLGANEGVRAVAAMGRDFEMEAAARRAYLYGT
jgi:hypothetical protein